jgi:hypothetical protein
MPSNHAFPGYNKTQLLQHIDQLSDQSARVHALETDNKNLRNFIAQHGLTAPKPTVAATFAFSAPVENVNNTINNVTFMTAKPGISDNSAATQAPQVFIPKWRSACKREAIGYCRRNGCAFAHQDQRAAYGEARINALPKYSARHKSQKK